MKNPIPVSFSLTATVLLLAACGGGGSSVSDPNETAAEAASATASTNARCTTIVPFYWEIGDVNGKLASGSVGANAPISSTRMPIASASKWLYAAYVVEKRGASGVSAIDDVPYLNFTSGYSNFPLPTCPGSGGTVDQCIEGVRGTLNATEAAGRLFHYNAGHMEKHASNFGLGSKNGETMATEIRSVLGTDLNITFTDVLMAGGGITDADSYARFLRKLLVGSPTPLRIGSVLGSHSVCTLPRVCPTAVSSPNPSDWHYSLGHWVEDDDASVKAGMTGYSSAGALGFYPWVNASRSMYGVIARASSQSDVQDGFESAQCGRLIRQAFVNRTKL